MTITIMTAAITIQIVQSVPEVGVGVGVGVAVGSGEAVATSVGETVGVGVLDAAENIAVYVYVYP